nr:hypothetical protein [uncultured Mediterraneibacter sp.]
MGLSNDLLSQFAKVTTDTGSSKSSETLVYGTAVEFDGKIYARLDGSDRLTPITTTTSVKPGDRVTVLIKNHTATITGNTTSPSASSSDIDDIKDAAGKVDDLGKKIDEFETIVADKVSTKDLDAVTGRIDTLVSDNVTINEKLTANEASIKKLEADNVTITGELDANKAKIDDLEAKKIDAEIADIKYATIENLNATNATINNLQANYGDFKNLTTEQLDAVNASIKNLNTEKLSVKDADVKYANIDFTNIGKAAIETFYAKSGIIEDLVIGDQTVSGTLVGVTIKGDLIEGGTVVADKLVIKGEDGLYYKLNTNGESVSSEQTEYNSLNGSIITAKSITAEKCNIHDLVAFNATIGGFNIKDHSIYSGVKEGPLNTTRGIYMDDDGQLSFGDSNSYLRYYKDTSTNKWKLEIAAGSIKLGTSGVSVEDKINDLENNINESIADVDVEYYLSTSKVKPAGGTWQTTAPAMVDGKYMWNRTVIIDGNGNKTYKPDENGVCITGASGSSGADGRGIETYNEEYYQSSSPTSLIGGKWVSDYPGWVDGKYIWTRTVITYSDGSSDTTDPICVTGSTGATGAAGKDGKGVEGSETTYQTGTSGTTIPTGTWTKDIPSVAEGQYLWTRVTTTYTDKTTSISYSVGRMGKNGSDGKDGVTYYTWLKYADTPTTGMSDSPDGKTYIGFAYNKTTKTESTDYSDYTWSLIKGKDGVDGGKGADGASLYTWVKYADDINGSNMSDSPDGKEYIGLAYNKTTQTKSSDPKNYTWSLFKGEDGLPGADGNGIEHTSVTYQASDSQTEAPTGEWLSKIPKLSDTTPYLWTKTVIAYSDSTTSISYSVSSTLDSVIVGGRNLIRYENVVSIGGEIDKNDFVSKGRVVITDSTENGGFRYDSADCYEPNTSYILSGYLTVTSKTFENFNIQNGKNVTCISFTIDGTNYDSPLDTSLSTMKSLLNDGEEHYVEFQYQTSASIPEDTDSNYSIIQLNKDSTTEITYEFRELKLEKGNIRSDWSPAPEDVNERIDNAQDTADSAQDTANSAAEMAKQASIDIDDIRNQISMLVTDENGETLMEQTSTGYTWNLGATKKQIESALAAAEGAQNTADGAKNVADNLAEQLEGMSQYNAYMDLGTDSYGNPCLILGRRDCDFKVYMTNTAIQFFGADPEKPIAYISKQKLYIEQAVVKNEFQIGEADDTGAGFFWKVRANGNAGIIYADMQEVDG